MKKCKKHPNYQAQRKPRSGCPNCEALWLENNPDMGNLVDLDLMAGEHKQEIGAIRKKYLVLQQRYKQLEQKQEVIDMLNQEFAPIRIKAKRMFKGSSEAVAMMVLSDWHVEERVTLKSVNGKNSFNPEIAESRAIHCFQNGLRLTNMFARDVNIHTIILALLGDFITNYLHDDNRETNSMPPAKAIEFAKKLLHSGIVFLLDNSKYNLVVPCCFGNHARMTAKPRSSNLEGTSLEYILYSWLADKFVGEDRVQFDVAEGAHLYTDIFDMKIRFHHGDRIRYQGGVGGLTIPLYKAINQWNKVVPVNYDILGHWHQSLLDWHSHLVNGSLIGWNAYASDIKASFEEPRQTFALFDRDRGLTFAGPIILSDVQRKAIND